MLQEIFLSLNRSPKSRARLAAELQTGLSVVDGALLQLARGKYVTKVPPAVESCSGGGCGACSMQNLCPSADETRPSDLNGPELWQLTEKGRSRVILTPTSSAPPALQPRSHTARPAEPD